MRMCSYHPAAVNIDRKGYVISSCKLEAAGDPAFDLIAGVGDGFQILHHMFGGAPSYKCVLVVRFVLWCIILR